MKKIELTQGQVALVDDCDYEYLSQWKWYALWMRNGYRARRNSPRVDGKQKAIYMHTVIAERMRIDPKMIDHKDRNSLNNQRSNLRSANKSQNGHNCGCRPHSETGVKGVSFHKGTGKFCAAIKLDGKSFNLGRFNTIPEAEAVVIAKRKELVGEFACA